MGFGRAGAGAVMVAALLTAAGCGYSFRGTLPEHIQTIAVPVFTNRTREPAVENVITTRHRCRIRHERPAARGEARAG